MELSTITEMDPKVAHTKYLEYRAAVRERHSDEDAAIRDGYRAMAEGKTLISLRRTIDAGGLNEQGLPALAVTRATAEWCYLGLAWHEYYRHEAGLQVTFSESENPPASARHVVRRVRGVFGEQHEQVPERLPRFSVRAMVPIVPPALRPARGLGRYHILWEVERWERAPRPPGDPALLRQIAGDLYAVVATWDLTELEQLVLARRTQP
jgi:hypothetical protein